MHPTDFDLLAEIHGEEVLAGADNIRLHVEGCLICFERRHALAREESEQRRLLRALDVSPPVIQVGLIRRRARVRRNRVRIAASIGTLITVASAAAAIPGSPVRHWLQRRSAPAPAASGIPLPKPDLPADGVQVSVTGSLVIMLGTPQHAGQIRIVRTGLAIATVRATGGDVGYRVGSGRINLDNRLPAERFDITIPRSLERFALLVGGRVLLRIDPRHPANASDTLLIDLARHGVTAP